MSLPNERGTWFLQRPAEGEDGRALHDLVFRLAGDWYALDGDKLLLPIQPVEKGEDDLSHHGPGILTQYGGAELLLSMASSDQEVEAGSEWILTHDSSLGFTISPLELSDEN